MFQRPLRALLLARVREPRRHVQVLIGPRQVGKTTLVQQVTEAVGGSSVYASADGPLLEDRAWIDTQWERGRLAAREAKGGAGLLVLDEVQKIPGWAELVKRLWDEDTRSKVRLKVVLLGSSALLVQKGLSESLAGRFEVIRVPHWSFSEMRDAFGWDLEKFLVYGGYPGAAPLADEHERWRQYVLDSLVETCVARDILLMSRVDKPALLRRLFELACTYSGQVLSYQKMIGQLQDAGNTTTLAHYLELLGSAGLVMGLAKFSAGKVRQRASSPKLLALNTALITAASGWSQAEMAQDREFRGRVVESAVGAHLVNTAAGTGVEIYYWLDRNREVDFVLRKGKRLTAIEVKSGRSKGRLAGLEAFGSAFKPQRQLLVGAGGIPLEEFLTRPAAEWMEP